MTNPSDGFKSSYDRSDPARSKGAVAQPAARKPTNITAQMQSTTAIS